LSSPFFVARHSSNSVSETMVAATVEPDSAYRVWIRLRCELQHHVYSVIRDTDHGAWMQRLNESLLMHFHGHQ
jgi:hypothetical protein